MLRKYLLIIRLGVKIKGLNLDNRTINLKGKIFSIIRTTVQVSYTNRFLRAKKVLLYFLSY